MNSHKTFCSEKISSNKEHIFKTENFSNISQDADTSNFVEENVDDVLYQNLLSSFVKQWKSMGCDVFIIIKNPESMRFWGGNEKLVKDFFDLCSDVTERVADVADAANVAVVSNVADVTRVADDANVAYVSDVADADNSPSSGTVGQNLSKIGSKCLQYYFQIFAKPIRTLHVVGTYPRPCL